MSKDSKSEEKKQKATYRIVNWSAYNKALKERGKLSLWLPANLADIWYETSQAPAIGKRKYSDLAIEFCLTIKQLYHLVYRQTQGFIEDLFSLLKLDLGVMSYSQLQRRQKDLIINMAPKEVLVKQHITLVIDSTGLKVSGEGEWKVRQHGKTKNRQWLKLHLASQPHNLEIMSQVLTFNDVDDATAGIEVIGKIQANIKTCAGDGAYDKEKFRAILSPTTQQLIPPQENAVLSDNQPLMAQRDQAIKAINATNRATWKKSVNYHSRSKAEVNMFRYKVILGDRIRAKKLINQKIEVSINCKILNQFAAMGLPITHKIERL